MSRVAVTCGVAITMLVAGCQGGSDNAESPEVPSISEAPGGPPANQTEPPAEPSTTTPPKAQPPVDDTVKPPGEKPAPASNPAECKVADLALGLNRGEAAAGTVYRQLRFTNKGDRTCIIQGFPGVSYVAGEDGHQVGPSAYREGTKGEAISLTPGMTVFAPVGFVQVLNYDPAVCKPTSVRGLRVYPPHEYDSVFVSAPGTGCAGSPPGNQLTVSTIQR
ncbi:DUF4232 domain-containing protein [Actinophytocola sp.]|uniref:DUF4232 domain-containing protein n=1 Tax=Actinophytocola sp. TaxID=1872138 RepID=UPI003D6AFDC0